MPARHALEPPLAGLTDLPQILEAAEGYPALIEALKQGRAATVDGAWNSSSALAAAALGRHAPATLLIVLPFPRDIDFWTEDLASFAGTRPVVFPAWDNLPSRETVIDEVAGQRLRVLKQLEGDSPPRSILTTLQALMQPVPDRQQLTAQPRRLRVGGETDLEGLIAWLVEHGFQRMEAVELPGEFSKRGGILDVFSHDADAPYRIEFLGDEIESIRQFAPDTQRSLGDVSAVEITAQGAMVSGGVVRGESSSNTHQSLAATPPTLGLTGHLCDYLPTKAWTVLVEPDDLQEQGKHYLERVTDIRGLFTVQGTIAQLTRFPSVRISALPSASMEATCHLRVESVERFSGDVTKLKDELDSAAAGDLVLIACH